MPSDFATIDPTVTITDRSGEVLPYSRDSPAVFEQVLVSDDIGVAEPRADAFGILNRRAATEDFCFVDDSQRNVDAATAAGIHALHVDEAAACARRTYTEKSEGLKGTS